MPPPPTEKFKFKLLFCGGISLLNEPRFDLAQRLKLENNTAALQGAKVTGSKMPLPTASPFTVMLNNGDEPRNNQQPSCHDLSYTITERQISFR